MFLNNDYRLRIDKNHTIFSSLNHTVLGLRLFDESHSDNPIVQLTYSKYILLKTVRGSFYLTIKEEKVVFEKHETRNIEP